MFERQGQRAGKVVKGAHGARGVARESRDRNDSWMSPYWRSPVNGRLDLRDIPAICEARDITDWDVDPGEVIGDAGENNPACAMRTLRSLDKPNGICGRHRKNRVRLLNRSVVRHNYSILIFAARTIFSFDCISARM